MLLERAEQAGAAIEKTRVLGIERRDRGWRLRTQERHRRSRFLHRRDGRAQSAARSGHGVEREGYDERARVLRAGVAGADRHSISAAAGRLHLGVSALRTSFGGDLRQGRAGASLCASGWRRYMNERAFRGKDAKFYSHMLPSLETPGWKKNRVRAMDGWRWAMRAGWSIPSRAKVCTTRCARAIWRAGWCWTTRTDSRKKRRRIGRCWRASSRWIWSSRRRSPRSVFLGTFMFDSVPARMVQFMRRSPRFRDLMQDLFAGTQPYLEAARAGCCKNLSGTLQEVLMNFLLNRVVPERASRVP